MNCLVTGAAGFIGSHLCERLLALGHHVTGIDSFNPYYDRRIKERNLSVCKRHADYQFNELDLRTDQLDHLVKNVEVIFHLAAMPGLTQSWVDFENYWTCNALATRQLLEAVRQSCPKLHRFIHVSTSSVYGKFASGDEMLATRPISPYGVTKLAAENLCWSFAEAWKLPIVILRYFSVYGPRQRPDMGYQRFIEAFSRKQAVHIYGDGLQVRGNTFVSDCVAATIAAVDAPVHEVFNIGGMEMANVWDIIQKLKGITGIDPEIVIRPERPGDQRHTFADCSKAGRHLRWQPQISLTDGLTQQWNWHLQTNLQT